MFVMWIAVNRARLDETHRIPCNANGFPMTQVWCGSEELLFGGLIVLTDDTLALADPDKKQLPATRQRLLAGEAPSAVLGSDATIIPIAAVRRFVTDVHDEDIEVEYASGASNETETLRLASGEKRDEVFAALKTAAGDRFTEYEESFSVPRSAFAPLMTLTICGALTWVFARAAQDVSSGANDPGFQSDTLKAIMLWFMRLFGPTGVYIVGGLLCALCLLSLVMRVKRPPTLLILNQGKHRPGTKLGLVFKYLLLLGAWSFVARVAWVA